MLAVGILAATFAFWPAPPADSPLSIGVLEFIFLAFSLALVDIPSALIDRLGISAIPAFKSISNTVSTLNNLGVEASCFVSELISFLFCPEN